MLGVEARRKVCAPCTRLQSLPGWLSTSTSTLSWTKLASQSRLFLRIAEASHGPTAFTSSTAYCRICLLHPLSIAHSFLPPFLNITKRWHPISSADLRARAGCFEAMSHHLRVLLCLSAGREATPTAAVMDRHNLQSTQESGERAGYDGAKRRKGSKVHLAVDTWAIY